MPKIKQTNELAREIERKYHKWFLEKGNNTLIESIATTLLKKYIIKKKV